MRAVRRVLSIGVLNIAVLLGGAAQHRANAETLFQWVQVGPEGTSVVRVVTDNACPNVVFDGREIATNLRSEINQKFDVEVPAAFPVRVCEVPVPAGSITGTLGEKVLPIARPNPRRIVVIGDRGCRVEKDKIQNCKNPDEWPFARIAAAAAATRPDLVIHVGDYEYRAALCPAGEEKKCGGSPEPYSWEAWKADFFAPAKPLLEAAPWIMVRGNHELCRRAGEGWFRFLDTAAFDGSCRDSTDPYVVKLGAFGVMVVDGAEAAKYGGDLGQLAEKVRGRLAEWQANLPDELWIATHPPIGGELAKPQAPGQTKPMPGNLSMVVSGHFHSFHTATFGGASTPQTVIGLGGAMLDTPDELAENRAALGASDSSPSTDFGYMVWDKSAEVWSGTLFDSHGKPTKSHCELKERVFHCDH